MYSRRQRTWSFYLGDFEITKGELILVCIAFVIWTTLCVFINMAIKNNTLENNEKYYKAVQIEEDSQLFEYAMKTNAGNALVYGKLEAVDPVSIPELTGKYLAIVKVTEEYTKHVTYQEDDEGNKKRVVRYTWDEVGTRKLTCTKVSFLGVSFEYDKIPVNNLQRLTLTSENVTKGDVHNNMIYEDSWISEDEGDKRFYYSVIPTSQKITVLADLRDNSMYNINGKNSVKIHYDTIPDVMKSIETFKNVPNILFTIVWYLAFVGLAYLFIYQANNWADC